MNIRKLLEDWLVPEPSGAVYVSRQTAELCRRKAAALMANHPGASQFDAEQTARLYEEKARELDAEADEFEAAARAR